MIQKPLDRKRVLNVFGPPMIQWQIEPKDVDILNEQCDELIANQKLRTQLDVSHRLSKNIKGDIQEELTCELKDNKFHSFRRTLYSAMMYLFGNKYKIKNLNMALDVHNAWYVRSFEGDFNPLHNHTEYNFMPQTYPYSCVGYLKVPDGITDKNKSGYIEFFDNGNSSGYAIQPIVGELYFFPSSLHHTVYPFRGDGERRSFSSNFSVRLLQ